MKLLNVTTLADARVQLKEIIEKLPRTIEERDLLSAEGCILAEDIFAPFQIPDFRRSVVDGYAVMASDTHGASSSIPVMLDVIEEVAIGEVPRLPVTHGTCSYVPTGGMIPDGANAMVMVEYCEPFDSAGIAVYQAVAEGSQIVLPGDDMKMGDRILEKGKLLRFQEIGALAAMGIQTVKVYRPFTATVISTGNELVPLTGSLSKGQVYDSNSYAVCASAEDAGMKVIKQILVPDDEELLKKTFRESMETSDFVITSGGSSQGKKDFTENLFNELSDHGVFVHGLALKPGKPTILAWDESSETVMIGLPGHPIAALIVFELLVVPLLHSRRLEEPVVHARMNINMAASPGRETCVPVRLISSENGYLAEPILGRSGLWSILTRADGYILIHRDQEGLRAGDPVNVILFKR